MLITHPAPRCIGTGCERARALLPWTPVGAEAHAVLLIIIVVAARRRRQHAASLAAAAASSTLRRRLPCRGAAVSTQGQAPGTRAQQASACCRCLSRRQRTPAC